MDLRVSVPRMVRRGNIQLHARRFSARRPAEGPKVGVQDFGVWVSGFFGFGRTKLAMERTRPTLAISTLANSTSARSCFDQVSFWARFLAKSLSGLVGRQTPPSGTSWTLLPRNPPAAELPTRPRKVSPSMSQGIGSKTLERVMEERSCKLFCLLLFLLLYRPENKPR